MIISFTKKDFRVDFVTVDVVVVKWRKKECFQCWPFFQLDYYITFTKNVLKIVSIIQWNILTDSWISFRVGLTWGCEMILHSFVDVGGPFGTFFSGLNIRGCGSLFKLIQKTFCICGFQNCKKRKKCMIFNFWPYFSVKTPPKVSFVTPCVIQPSFHDFFREFVNIRFPWNPPIYMPHQHFYVSTFLPPSELTTKIRWISK